MIVIDPDFGTVIQFIKEKERAMKKLVQKLNRGAGFTFSEMMVAIVILVMISAMALPAALNAYQNAVDAANAHVLLSTTVNALRGELSTAWNVTVDEDNKTITYQSSDTGGQSVLSLTSVPFTIREYNDFNSKWLDSDATVTAKPNFRLLVTAAMSRETKNPKSNMTVALNTTGKVEKKDGYIVITGLEVKRGDTVITKMPDSGLLIRYIGGDEST